jgi:hypothetical protein
MCINYLPVAGIAIWEPVEFLNFATRLNRRCCGMLPGLYKFRRRNINIYCHVRMLGKLTPDLYHRLESDSNESFGLDRLAHQEAQIY